MLSRRLLLKFASLVLPVQAVSRINPGTLYDLASPSPIRDVFPSEPPELIREMVLVSHFDLKRVQEIVETRPALARAAFDWGFGDWEDALGAASHMGNRPIAEYLISKGARPTLFSAAMLGQLDIVKGFIAANPGAQRIRGPHSISLLAHAKFGGPAARAVLDYLQSLGDAGDDPEAPLSDADRAKILGTYVFGGFPSQQIELTLEHNRMLNTDQLTWTRKGTFGRPLHHQGDHVFCPAGAPAVKIRFTEENSVTVMTVHDPDVILTARRRA